MRGLSPLSLLLLLLVAAAPATAPTSAPFDPATPKGALKLFSRALDAGDRKTILEILAADTDEERKLAAATADLAEASAAIRKSAIKAFGDVQSRALGVDPTASTAALARIDAATETITGETAVVRTPDNEGPPMTLVKRNGRWLLPAGELSKDVEAADIDKNLADVAMQISVMRTMADEVAAGKFATATDARQALDHRIIKAAMPQLGPATKPSSKPATAHSK